MFKNCALETRLPIRSSCLTIYYFFTKRTNKFSFFNAYASAKLYDSEEKYK